MRPDQVYQLRDRTILGVNPPVFDFAWFDLWAKPLGLLNLLGFLRDRGNRVSLVDCLHEGRTRPLSHGRWKVRREPAPKPEPLQSIPRRYHRFGLSAEDFRARVAAGPAPDLILVTSIMTYWYPGVFETIGILREVFPRTPIGLGGIYATLCPEHARKSGADFPLTRPSAPRPAATPLDLYDQPTYAVLATSYGCPRRCDYCASSLLEPRFQPRPLAEILRDLDQQMALGSISDLAFFDDALLWDRENRLYPLADHLETRYPALRLHTPNGLSVAQIDERCAESLRRAGFKTLRLSLEGLDERTTAAGAGKADRQSYGRAVASLLRAGYRPEDLETYLLVGLPGQSVAEVERAIGHVRSLGGRPKLCEFSPIPGTRLYAEAARAHPVLAAEPLWHNNTLYAPHLAGHPSPEELQRLKNMCRSEY